jgi:hypothetical protein
MGNCIILVEDCLILAAFSFQLAISATIAAISVLKLCENGTGGIDRFDALNC